MRERNSNTRTRQRKTPSTTSSTEAESKTNKPAPLSPEPPMLQSAPLQQQYSPPSHNRLGSVSSSQTPPSMHSLQEEEGEHPTGNVNNAENDSVSSIRNGSAISERLGKVSSVSSIDTIDQTEEAYLSDCPSDDLDKLSMCLSEASSEDVDKKSSMFSDIVQAQLALWTLIGSIFYSYAWQQHRKKFLFSLFVMVPMITIVCCTLSSLLTAIVIIGRVFSTPVRFQDVFKMGANPDDEDKTRPGAVGKHGSIRRRSTSGNSVHSSMSGRSTSCEELPKPVCRKHSTSNGSSLNLVCGTPTMYSSFNGGLNGFSGSSSNGFRGSAHGLNGRSTSVCNSPKRSYQYTHTPADCKLNGNGNGTGLADANENGKDLAER